MLSDAAERVGCVPSIGPELATSYAGTLASLKSLVASARLRAQRVVNAAMIELDWKIGRTILERQQSEPWGSKVLGRLADDLRREYPDMKGFSRRNLYYMRARAEAWNVPDEFVQTASAQLPKHWIYEARLSPTRGTLWQPWNGQKQALTPKTANNPPTLGHSYPPRRARTVGAGLIVQRALDNS